MKEADSTSVRPVLINQSVRKEFNLLGRKWFLVGSYREEPALGSPESVDHRSGRAG